MGRQVPWNKGDRAAKCVVWSWENQSNAVQDRRVNGFWLIPWGRSLLKAIFSVEVLREFILQYGLSFSRSQSSYHIWGHSGEKVTEWWGPSLVERRFIKHVAMCDSVMEAQYPLAPQLLSSPSTVRPMCGEAQWLRVSLCQLFHLSLSVKWIHAYLLHWTLVNIKHMESAQNTVWHRVRIEKVSADSIHSTLVSFCYFTHHVCQADQTCFSWGTWRDNEKRGIR